jgi:Chloroplast import component protein (Tic20).
MAIAFVYLATDDDFIRKNAMNALHWHVPVSVIAIVVVVFGVVVSEIAGVALAVTLAIATICAALIASMKARNGRAWKYPVVSQLL